MTPPVVNPLRLYTELLTNPIKVLEFEEFSGLGPKTSVKEISRMWIQSHQRYEWTVVTVDPLGFTDSITARSTNKTETRRHGNHQSWQRSQHEEFANALMPTGNTLLIVEGTQKDLPIWYDVFDRVVLVKPPSGMVPLA